MNRNADGGVLLLKVFTLKFDPLSGLFDDTSIRDFSVDKEILGIRDYLFIKNEIPYLILIIKYYPFRKEAQSEVAQSDSKNQDAWKKEIGDAELPLFNILRSWRAERCKRDGIPPYLVFTNYQLAMIAKRKPQSLNELGQIDGVGRGKLERYGVEILEMTIEKKDG